MDKLIAKMQELGISVNDGMTDDQIQSVAKAVGLEPLEYVDRNVEIVDYTNKRNQTNKFVSTPAFILGKDKDGKTKTTRGLFLRVEALDQAIEDLLAAKAGMDKE